METLRLYSRYIGLSIRSQMQYRASFAMMSFGHFAVTGIEFLGVWAMFHRFGHLRGWSLAQVALFYGVVNVAFAFADGLGRGFDLFPNMVKRGDFDRLLVRPRSTTLQVLGQELQLMRVGRLAQGLAVLLWAAWRLDLAWSFARVALILAMIAGCISIFLGLFVLQATMAFWTVESLEIWNSVTYGGMETAQYPVTLYRPWFRWFFTLVVPLACTSYFPANVVLGRIDSLGTPVLFQCLAPGIGLLFLWLSLRAWRVGVRHYCSTGS